MVLSIDSDRAITEVVKTETMAERSKNILAAMEWIPIRERLSKLPDLSDWNEWEDERKLQSTRDVLSHEKWEIDAFYSDDRSEPTIASHDQRNKYGTFILPWMGQYYRAFGREKFEEGMRAGSIDVMVKEMRDADLLRPDLDPDGEVVSAAASTSNVQFPWQYDQSLQLLEKMREIASGSNDWSRVKDEFRKLQLEQDSRLKRTLGLLENDVIVRMPSGSDLPLLNGLTGAIGCQITDETGTASAAAASGRHTSRKGVRGHVRKPEENGKLPKLKGMEQMVDSLEVTMRDKTGEVWDPEVVRAWVAVWMTKMREDYPGCRLVVGVTAGSKTGLYQQAGLDLQDAIDLSNQFGGNNGEGVLVAVDDSQARLGKSEVLEIRNKRVMIDFTGSKILGGAGYSAARYFPQEYVAIVREEVATHPELVTGLSEYLSQDEVRELLGDELLSTLFVFPDMPAVFSMLKWEGPIRLDENLEGIDRVDRMRIEPKVRTLMNMIRESLESASSETVNGELQPKNINDHTWNVVIKQEHPWYQPHSGFELLMPIQIYVDGELLKEKTLRAIGKAMSEPGVSGRMVPIGQYVASADVLRVAFDRSLELGLSKPGSLEYSTKIANVISGKLQGVIEDRLKEMKQRKGSGVARWRTGERAEWEEKLSRMAYERVGAITERDVSVSEKVQGVVDLYATLFAHGEVEPVVLMSGKSAAALDIIDKAWTHSGKSLEMPLPTAFVDHPYVLRDKNGEVLSPEDSPYQVVLKSLQRYSNTHLYLYGADYKLVAWLSANGMKDRFTVASERSELTEFERRNPDWFRTVYEVTSDQAQGINEAHKGQVTDRLIDNSFKRLKGRVLGIVRGNRPRQSGREIIMPINVSDERDMLMLHPLAGLTEEEIKRYVVEQNVPNLPSYIDWLKEVQKACGLDIRFKPVIPIWWSEKQKASLKDKK